ncbi:MAG TPA: glycosyltransferase family 39 protein, partial [Polyangiaceae bacterium]|nr:glycosyltransferase family 39 protein [Polyangiaceae bacterium]
AHRFARAVSVLIAAAGGPPRWRSLLGRAREAPARSSDALWIAAIGLALRIAVAVWAADKFPPTDDGHFYQIVADRIAHGQGYTWLWPDGAVSYAAHYPIGYPALLGGAYALFGSRPVIAMIVNALLGAGAVFGAHRLAAASVGRLGAALGALLVALHPGLVFYTPALMTEGIAAALVTLGAWLSWRAASRGPGALIGAGLMLGLATLVRPQLLLAVPLLGLMASAAGATASRRVKRALLLTALSLLTCLPWTVRNCARLERCAFVSANGGWNLLIGTAERGRGGWVPLETLGVPEECRSVFGEADKDHCFGRAALRRIAEHPVRWLLLVPAKLMMTFEYSGAAAYYLHAANGSAFSDADKRALGASETVYERLVLLLALFALWKLPGPRARARRLLALLSGVCVLLPLAWLGHLGLLASALLLGARLFRHPAVVAAASVVFATALTHAVFFGAGRYGLVAFAVLGSMAGLALFGSPAERKAETELFDRQTASGDTRAAGDTDAADRN